MSQREYSRIKRCEDAKFWVSYRHGPRCMQGSNAMRKDEDGRQACDYCTLENNIFACKKQRISWFSYFPPVYLDFNSDWDDKNYLNLFFKAYCWACLCSASNSPRVNRLPPDKEGGPTFSSIERCFLAAIFSCIASTSP